MLSLLQTYSLFVSDFLSNVHPRVGQMCVSLLHSDALAILIQTAALPSRLVASAVVQSGRRPGGAGSDREGEGPSTSSIICVCGSQHVALVRHAHRGNMHGKTLVTLLRHHQVRTRTARCVIGFPPVVGPCVESFVNCAWEISLKIQS